MLLIRLLRGCKAAVGGGGGVKAGGGGGVLVVAPTLAVNAVRKMAAAQGEELCKVNHTAFFPLPLWS